MQAAEYDTLRAVEDRHWWYAVLHGLVLRALAGGLPAHAQVLDAGCGTGGMLVFLRERMQDLDAAGIDASEQAVWHCQQRGLAGVRNGTVHELPFEDGAFDAVLSLDVLYHAGVDEDRALAEMSRVLRPGGLLVLNLPAFAGLRGAHDAAVCGVRRYKASHMRPLLEPHNLHVEMIHYWNAWLFLPLLVWRRWSRVRMKHADGSVSDVKLPPTWLNRSLAGAGRLDAWLCRVLRLPLGSSVFAVARRMNSPSGGHGDGGGC
ncbi:MAG: class I SAM-dependent methyltransferase [Prosthecobacter sp.]|uniref:class I SAM-dependent methyltransferase n=1 Tax=Prosthecobacter sp. TaxID=1965333 RepID=UPI003900DD07